MEPAVESNSSANNQDDTLAGPSSDEIREATIDIIGGLEEAQRLDVSNDSLAHVGSVEVLRHPRLGYVANQQTQEEVVEFPLRYVDPTNEWRIAGQNENHLENLIAVNDKQLAPSESRLNAILCCTVCLDLPKTSCYQCLNGHLMCEKCINRILADAHLQNITARCPSCRCEMNDDFPYVRNLAVEKAVSELATSCQFCQEQFPRRDQLSHLATCTLKPVPCRFTSIGCTWEGPVHELSLHHENCALSALTGEQVAQRIEERHAKDVQAGEKFDIFEILSLGDVKFAEFRLESYHTDSVNPQLYYESNSFTLLNKNWGVRAKIISDDQGQTNPLHAINRSIVFQLKLKSRTFTPICTNFMLMRGNNCEIEFRSNIYKFEFTAERGTSDYVSLGVTPEQCDYLTTCPDIYFRLLIAKPMQ